jgi:hypothetical protein
MASSSVPTRLGAVESVPAGAAVRAGGAAALKLGRLGARLDVGAEGGLKSALLLLGDELRGGFHLAAGDAELIEKL